MRMATPVRRLPETINFIWAMKDGWTCNGNPCARNAVHVMAGSHVLLQFSTDPNLREPQIHLEYTPRETGELIDIIVPTGVPIPNILPVGTYTVVCRCRTADGSLDSDIRGTLNVGTGTEDLRGNSTLTE